MIALLPYLVVMFILLFSSLWVGAALGIPGFVACIPKIGFENTLLSFSAVGWKISTMYTLMAVPMFIFMGEIMYHGGFIDLIYTRSSKVVSGLPGDLLHSNILACTIFASCSGSSLASAATIGSVGYPIQKERGYNKGLSLGSICAGGTLGILIPPSIPMIIYATIVEESIGKLFLAGVVPGVILAVMFSLYIFLAVIRRPSNAPAKLKGATFLDRLGALAGLWQVGVLVVVVLGGIYAGVATPTEVAALGSTMACIFVAFGRRFTWKALKNSLKATVAICSMILFVVVGAFMLSQALFYYNVAPELARFVDRLGLTPTEILLAVTVLYLIMGMFFDAIPMKLLTLPFVYPILVAAGFDLVWFGIYLVVLIEIGLLTPPVGLNLYILGGVTKEPLGLIIKGAAPFLIPMFVMLIMLVFFPQLAMWLPSLM
ncbi:TRAP transporter large permease [Chloroflexota bacterium]